MMIDPTTEQAELCAIVQQELVETINRLLAEGIDVRIVTAGLAAASVATVIRAYGPAEVPVWFARQSVLSRALSGLAG